MLRNSDPLKVQKFNKRPGTYSRYYGIIEKTKYILSINMIFF